MTLTTPTLLSGPVGASQAPSLTPTRLDVKAALGRQSATALTIPRLQARLTTNAGRPLAGRTIRFSVIGRPGCSAATNENGVASCRAVLNVHAVSGTYAARFDGDSHDRPARGVGLLLVVKVPGPPPPSTTTTIPNPSTTTTFPNPSTTFLPPTSTSTSFPGQTTTTVLLPTSTAPTSSTLPVLTTTSTTPHGGTLPPITSTTIGDDTTIPVTTIPPTTTTLPPTTTTFPPTTTLPPTTTTFPPTPTTFPPTTTTAPGPPAGFAAAIFGSSLDPASRLLAAEGDPRREEEVGSFVVDRFNDVIAPLLAQIEASCDAAHGQAPRVLGFARAVALILPDAAILSSTVVDSVGRGLGRCP